MMDHLNEEEVTNKMVTKEDRIIRTFVSTLEDRRIMEEIIEMEMEIGIRISITLYRIQELVEDLFSPAILQIIITVMGHNSTIKAKQII